jgi:hypothetical protein
LKIAGIIIYNSSPAGQIKSILTIQSRTNIPKNRRSQQPQKHSYRTCLIWRKKAENKKAFLRTPQSPPAYIGAKQEEIGEGCTCLSFDKLRTYRQTARYGRT